jgi:hypothetical protein
MFLAPGGGSKVISGSDMSFLASVWSPNLPSRYRRYLRTYSCLCRPLALLSKKYNTETGWLRCLLARSRTCPRWIHGVSCASSSCHGQSRMAGLSLSSSVNSKTPEGQALCGFARSSKKAMLHGISGLRASVDDIYYPAL